MDLLKKQRGLTFIETMITAAIISFIVLGTINLISFIYKGITANQLKSYALNIVSEQIDLLKQDGYEGCAVTDDSCLPNPLSNLETCTLNDTYERVTVGAQVFEIYRYVMYAFDDGSGNMVPKKQSDITDADGPLNLKQITVMVNYKSYSGLKTTTVTTLLSNKEVAINGSSVSGNVMLHHPSGPDTNPGLGSNASVHFVGYPQYTTNIDSDAGHYTVPNVMPGSYTLYAEGSGFTTTYLATNPLYVSPIATAIIGVNFSCDAVQGSSVSGRIYINALVTNTNTFTPTPTVPATYTPTPVCARTVILVAVPTMAGKTSNWSNVGFITADDTNYSSAAGNTQRLYTEFRKWTPTPGGKTTVICSVMMHSKSYVDIISTGNNNTLSISLSKNTAGVITWADLISPAGWGGNQDSIRDTWMINYTVNTNEEFDDITDLYTTWDWAKVNSVGACFRTDTNKWLFGFANCTAYMNIVQLEVAYDEVQFTFTVTRTPTNTNTPNFTFTPTPQCGVGASVMASDGLSAPYIATDCDYTVSNINPATGMVDISAVMMLAGDTYYAVSQSVAVSPGSPVTGVDLVMNKLNGIPSLKGLVFDASNHSIALSGVDIYLGTTKVATTGGGGAYAVVPVTPGDWELDATAAGYNLVQTQSLHFAANSGLQTANPLYMMPSGNISGKVIDFVTGQPKSGVIVYIQSASGANLYSANTDDNGVYLINGVDVGTSYKVQVNINSSQKCLVPNAFGYYSNQPVIKGVTTFVKDFKIQDSYKKIAGKVQVDGIDIKNGVTIMAVPISVTRRPDEFRINDTTNTYLQKYTGRNRIVYPMYSLTLERDGTFEIKAPVNTSYNIYAYYSYVSYTGTVDKPIKNVRNFYKKLSNVTVGTSDLTNQNITGTLGSWQSY